MSLTGLIACALIGAWLLLTLAYQYFPFQATLARRDAWHMLPSWAFFAPRPTYHDPYLLVRDLRADGSLGALRIVRGPSERTWLHPLWNPDKRAQRVFQDAAQAIRRLRRWAACEDVVLASLPYLLLLHDAVRHLERDSGVQARQFIIVETSGREEERLWISFVSGFHRVSPDSDWNDFRSL
jgi:hypothetical protein